MKVRQKAKVGEIKIRFNSGGNITLLININLILNDIIQYIVVSIFNLSIYCVNGNGCQ